VTGKIALVEVQGYVFAALRRLADVVDARGDAKWAGRLRQRADLLRAAVEDRFWLPEEGFYAQALDGNKSPVRAISSNPGHLLYCELPSTERAALVARRLLTPDLFSGWGVRTLSSRMTSFNPMSYHNGSVWPHDNSLIVDGLYRYGLTDAANRIAEAILDASNIDPLARLPELYCGFARAESVSDVPVGYPVSCSPQAWAAAAPALMVRAMLGLRVDPVRNRLVTTPSLPPSLGSVSLQGLRFGGENAGLDVRRHGDRYDVTVSGPIVVET
jgi:glycogen debranching enzyme